MSTYSTVVRNMIYTQLSHEGMGLVTRDFAQLAEPCISQIIYCFLRCSTVLVALVLAVT